MNLSKIEQRIIGCLLEKQTTTPDQYPLSLNALTNACNQKSNREPVMSLTESDVLDALAQLEQKRIVVCDEGLSGRVNKYQHRFCNSEFGSLQLTEQQRAVICLLLLRGPQTPGELRTRSGRLAEFATVGEVEAALNELQQQELAMRLAREPGKREARYQHLFGNPEDYEQAQESASEPTVNLDELLQEIDQLKQELQTIKQHLGL
ncbi:MULTISPECIES: YceH family protein [unclassified Pseudoalteromonas]|uniref:YceH family protein n=1 Tax=unclassified Pseudoalteromonas TaxID=194690 RepID=UPI002097874A|nr:YceH family protein [Pseudoalteromonas sp. XMcav2-N]MCO7190965.1 YceH family protein [Pseudoalteromonas sp. XMcav2-N]